MKACKHKITKVSDSRDRESYVYRMRVCLKCSVRFKTMELRAADFETLVGTTNDLSKAMRLFTKTITKLRLDLEEV